MSKLIDMFDKFILTIWPGILILLLNSYVFYWNWKLGASDWSIFANIFGVVFSVRILYDHFRWKRRIENYVSKEFDEIMKVVKPELDAMFAEMMKDFSEEKYKQFLVEANKIIDREARRRGRLRVSRSDNA